MATLPPLEFDLAGLEEYRRPATRGVQAGSQFSDLAEKTFRDNAARRAASLARAGVTPEMIAQANRFGAAGPGPTSIPAGDNISPVATARAAAAPSFGARLMAGASKLVKPIAVGATAFDIGRRAGELLTPDKAAVGMADAVGRLGQFLGIDSLGQYADGARQFAAAQTIPDVAPGTPAVQPPAPAPAALAEVTAPAAAPGANPRITRLDPNAGAAAAARFIDGTEVPADGSGYIRNESTGAVTQLNGGVRAARRGVTRAGAPARPTLGTDGGIFENLSQFQNDLAGYALPRAEAAAVARGARRDRELTQKETDSADNRATQRENAESNRLRAIADILKEQNAGAKENKKVVQDVSGAPIVVDLKNNSAQKITPTERPTVEKFLEAAKKDSRNKGLTDAQLRAYYNRNYGG